MQNRLKLLFMVEAMGGGVFTYLVDLANELVNTYDIYIAYAIRPQTPSDYTSYFDHRIHLIEVKNFERSVNLIKDIKALIEMKQIEKKIQPDIIHLHSSKAGVLGRWGFNGHKVVLFYTPHGYSFLMKNQSIVNRMIYKKVEALSAKRSCITISCSKGEYQETLKLTKRATYVDNGINIVCLEKLINTIQTEQTQQLPFTVFTLGRICYQKCPELFNHIAEALPDCRFVWIGDGELREQLTAPNIEITGWMERNSALKVSLTADMFVLTSLWEGLPMSLLEAMYLKKPCAVSNVIGNRDVIHNEINGYVCDSVEDFVKAVNTVRHKEIQPLIEHAYQEVIHTYNTSTMAEKYHNIYETTIRSKTDL